MHSSILKECGYSVKQSTSKTVTGSNKIAVSFEGKGGLPFIAEAKGTGTYEHTGTNTNTDNNSYLELDPNDVNDIVRALIECGHGKFIVREDFHYLPDETQRDMAFSLKAFHEKSKITFVVVGVWREENRLIAYNGDLTDRVFVVDVDAWTPASLEEVIPVGESLLNVNFDQEFIIGLVNGCFDSVHIVQEVCRRCLREEGVFHTQDTLRDVGSKSQVSDFIKQVVAEQGGRYNSFITNFADGFQQTDLEMPKWIIFALLNSTIEQISGGIRLQEISRLIKSSHPKGGDLNAGNITQALISASSLQVKKNIRPIIIDYDTTNRKLHVVDKSFLIWLASQSRDELLSDLGLEAVEFKEAI